MNMAIEIAMPRYQCLLIARAMIWPFTGTDQNRIKVAMMEAKLAPRNGVNMTNANTINTVRIDPQAMIEEMVCVKRLEKPVTARTMA